MLLSIRPVTRYLTRKACAQPILSTFLRRSSNLPQDTTDNKLTIPPLGQPVPQKFLRKIPCEHHGIEPSAFNDETIWIPVYRFPYINACRKIVRYKVYLTFASVGTCVTKLYQSLFVIEGSLLATAILSSVTLTGLVIVGNFFRKLIVQVYVSEDLNYIRFVRFSFFANRIDIVLPKEIVYPLTETNAAYHAMLLKIKTKRPEKVNLDYDNYEFYDEVYNLTLRFGGIQDKRKFEHALGRILTTTIFKS